VNHVISALNVEVRKNSISRFPPDLPGLCSFTHFCLRFGAEISDDVSPPFKIHVQIPGQRSITMTLENEAALNRKWFEEELNA
ncbi:hypothetical protein KA005_15720, partial [bacterium]|nr:hypothetical protein [bacterium]